MLQPSYKRSLEKNYFILEGREETSHNYQLAMIRENNMRGMLDFEVRYIDEGVFYYYDISGKQTLQGILEKRMLSYEQIKIILLELYSILQQAKSYLIDMNHMLFDPRYIYCDYECKKFWIVFYIDYEMEYKNPFVPFVEYLLEQINHEDEQAVGIGYELYQQVRRDNFTYEQFMILIEEKNRENVEHVVECVETEKEEIELSDSVISYHVQEGEEETKGNTIFFLLIVFGIACIFVGAGIYIEIQLPQYEMEKLVLFGLAGLVVAGGMTHYFLQRAKVVKMQARESMVVGENESIPVYMPMDGEPRERSHGRNQNQPLHTKHETYEEHTVYMGNVRHEEKLLIGNWNKKEIRFALETFPCMIGKSKEHAEIVIDHPSVSRMHAKITQGVDGLYIEDLNSVNGTYKNGVILETNERVRLEIKDELQFGTVYMEYR